MRKCFFFSSSSSSFSCFSPVCIYRPKQSDFAGMAGIFSSTKQRGYLYGLVDRYGIYRPYRPIRYKINFLGRAAPICGLLLVLRILVTNLHILYIIPC